MLEVDEEKTALNARVKASMDEFLPAKSWPEKVRSIERMNAASKIARASMTKALVQQRVLAQEGADGKTTGYGASSLDGMRVMRKTWAGICQGRRATKLERSCHW